jgi:hypothetical protein
MILTIASTAAMESLMDRLVNYWAVNIKRVNGHSIYPSSGPLIPVTSSIGTSMPLHAINDRVFISPYVDSVHRTPASWWCPQLWLRLKGQSISVTSLPVHLTSSITIGPVPCPNLALPYAFASGSVCAYSSRKEIQILHNFEKFWRNAYSLWT